MSTYIRRFWSYLRGNETAKGLFLVGVVLLGAIGIWAGVRVALNTEFPVLVVSSGSMCQRLTNPAIDKCTLAIGDLIVIRGQDPSSITPTCSGGNKDCTSSPTGTIIVFRPPAPYSNDPNFLVVHRVVAELQTGQSYSFFTRGDSNFGSCYCASANDPWDSAAGVPAANVVGVYQYTVPIPYLGSAILSIRGFMYNDQTGQPRPEGLAVIVLLILALFAFEIIEPSGKKSKTTSPPSPRVPRIPSEEPGLPETGQD